MPLRLLSTEVSYVQSVLEETLEEVEESGTFLALRESVAKSRERNKEKNEIGLVINNNKGANRVLKVWVHNGAGREFRGILAPK